MTDVQPAASEFQAEQKPKRKYDSVLTSVCSFIICNEFCERMAFYGFQGSLVLFFTRELGYSSSNADSQQALWNGMCYLTPLIGGWAADTYMGRYRGIMFFISIYFVGMLTCSIAAQPEVLTPYLFFPGLYIVALGTGGIKPNVSTFGADQFDRDDPKDAKELEGFFNWFYFSINLGAMISFTVIAYLCQNVSFGVGYIVPTVSMALSILVFWLGNGRYKKYPAQGSVLSAFFKTVWDGLRAPKERKGEHWLDRARKVNGGEHDDTQVDGAKDVVKLVPFLLLFIVYWGIYSQMSTTFFNQACQMNIKVGSTDLPITALNLFDTVAILILIPIFEKFLYPCLERRGSKLSMLKKIGLGFLFAVLAMLVAGILEVYRLSEAKKGHFVGKSICADKNPPDAVDISVFWQVPQFLLIGTSEVFASVTSIEFFYSQAPETMRSVCSALNLVTTAFGTWLTALLIPIVNADPNNEWIQDDANKGHLDYYFFMLSGLMLLNTFIFAAVARKFEYKKDGKPGSAEEPLLSGDV